MREIDKYKNLIVLEQIADILNLHVLNREIGIPNPSYIEDWRQKVNQTYSEELQLFKEANKIVDYNIDTFYRPICEGGYYHEFTIETSISFHHERDEKKVINKIQVQS